VQSGLSSFVFDSDASLEDGRQMYTDNETDNRGWEIYRLTDNWTDNRGWEID